MSKISAIIKKIAGIATALTTSLSMGCHMSEPKCYYGPAPMPESQDDDTKPEVLEDDSDNPDAKPDYRNYPAHNSNEALDVYGPPPTDLDDPDINPDMLNEPETVLPDPEVKENVNESNTQVGDYKDINEPVYQALYGVKIDELDR